MAFTNIDPTSPNGTDKKKFGDDQIRTLKQAVIDNLAEISNYPASTKPALKTAIWTTATRPASDELIDRITGYNTDLGCEEYYDLASTSWQPKKASALASTGQSNLLLTIYPIGSIYMSTNNTSPATLFGGTWEQIQDRFLLAAGSSYAAGTTGGEVNHTLTISEMPNHSHYYTHRLVGSGVGERGWDNEYGGQMYTGTTSAVGGGAAHNNMPPYLAVYMWKRTA